MLDLWKVMQAYIISSLFAVQRTVSTITGLTYMDVYPTPKDTYNEECTNLYWYPRPLPPHCYWSRPTMAPTPSITPKQSNCVCTKPVCVTCLPCLPCIATCSWCVPGCVPGCRSCDDCSKPSVPSVEGQGIKLISFYEPQSIYKEEDEENKSTEKSNIHRTGSDSREIRAFLEDILQKQIIRKKLKRRKEISKRIRNKNKERIQRRRETFNKIRELLDDLKYNEYNET